MLHFQLLIKTADSWQSLSSAFADENTSTGESSTTNPKPRDLDKPFAFVLFRHDLTLATLVAAKAIFAVKKGRLYVRHRHSAIGLGEGCCNLRKIFF